MRRGAVALVLQPQFTLLALSAFIDAVRLAADERDGSRQIRCSWSVLNHENRAMSASCGLEVFPTEGLRDPKLFDCVVVVGSLLRGGHNISPEIVSFIRRAAESDVPLIGICTGTFILPAPA